MGKGVPGRCVESLQKGSCSSMFGGSKKMKTIHILDGSSSLHFTTTPEIYETRRRFDEIDSANPNWPVIITRTFTFKQLLFRLCICNHIMYIFLLYLYVCTKSARPDNPKPMSFFLRWTRSASEAPSAKRRKCEEGHPKWRRWKAYENWKHQKMWSFGCWFKLSFSFHVILPIREKI